MVDCRCRNGSQGTVRRTTDPQPGPYYDFRNHDNGGSVGLAGCAVGLKMLLDSLNDSCISIGWVRSVHTTPRRPQSTPNHSPHPTDRQTDSPTMVKNCCNLGASVTWMGTPPAVSAPLPIVVQTTRPAHLMNTYHLSDCSTGSFQIFCRLQSERANGRLGLPLRKSRYSNHTRVLSPRPAHPSGRVPPPQYKPFRSKDNRVLVPKLRCPNGHYLLSRCMYLHSKDTRALAPIPRHRSGRLRLPQCKSRCSNHTRGLGPISRRPNVHFRRHSHK
jgi:hypothetical protein